MTPDSNPDLIRSVLVQGLDSAQQIAEIVHHTDRKEREEAVEELLDATDTETADRLLRRERVLSELSAARTRRRLLGRRSMRP